MNTIKIKRYQIFSAIFVCILGTFLHFTYELSGKNIFIASFSAVNESVWEHLKLLFFPMLLTTIIGYFFLHKTTTNFICSKTIGIITSMLFTVIFFYTYSGILGTNIAIIDISSFFIATILGEFTTYKLINTNFKCNNKLSFITLIFIELFFIIFTFLTPQINIFKDPITNQYGILRINT